MISEPRMESLLASIRKAIDEDIGGTGQNSRPTNYVRPIGMRQMPVAGDQPAREGGEPNSATDEIRDLRERIRIAREREANMRSAVAPKAPQPARSSVFAETLGGESARNRPPRQRAERPQKEPVFEQPEPVQQQYGQHEDINQPEFPGATDVAVVDAWNENLTKHVKPKDSRSQMTDSSMLSTEAATAANTAFNRLADTILSRAVGDRSVEEITRELLRDMLKQWLNINLPGLVEKLVREEIERVARRGR